MPKISIIVPVYNCEKYLERCLDSIINQTFRNWECILVDDGSTDRSGKILDEYAEKDDRFAVFHKSNKGVSSARNYGMLKCKGDWVTFVDSDDWVENGWLKEFDDIIKIADFDIIRFGYYLDTRLASHKVSCGKDKTVTLRWLMLKEYHNNKYYGYLWNTVFNMRCVQTLRFDTSLHFCEDQLFLNNAITNAKNTYLSSRCFYHYQKEQSDSLSNVKDAKQIYDAATKNFLVEMIIIGDNDSELQEIAHSSYHNNLVGSIITAYTFYSRTERRIFYYGFNLMTYKGINWRERFYITNLIPFWVKDFILRLYMKIKNHSK